MAFEISGLPYSVDALMPYISAETMEYHYGKHHAAYVTHLNELIPDTEFEKMTLKEIILKSEGSIFNNAAQIWNHTFFWDCLTPHSGGHPSGKVAKLINDQWGSFELFKEKFTASALANFGSGWTWLVRENDGPLEILNTSNAQTPLTSRNKVLMTIDIWEHAYYIDHRNDRAGFISAYWKLVNWDFVNKNLV